MANYIENFNSKLDWAMPFQRTGKFPLDRSSIFSSYADAVLYAAGGADARGLGGTSYVGQLIVVFENDVVTAYKINADRTIEALTSASGVDAEILELTTALNNEIAARKAVDGQTGQTYASNTSASHISAATSLNDADIKLNDAITAETKARQDAINALDSTIEKDNGNFGITITQTDGLLDSLTISDIVLSSGFSPITYPEIESVSFTPAEVGDTLDFAIEKIDTNISTLVQEVLKNEEVTAAAFTEIKESAGLDENLKYVKDASANYISEATTFSEADSLLDAAIGNLNLVKVTGTELSDLGSNVKEAYKFVDGANTKHGEYVKIYKDSSLDSVILDEQELVFSYVLADGSVSTVRVNISSFLAESEFKDGLQVNSNGEVSIKIDSTSDPYLTVSSNGIKLSGISDVLNNLESDITSDDTALVNVQIKQVKGLITDVIVTGNDIDCGTF